MTRVLALLLVMLVMLGGLVPLGLSKTPFDLGGAQGSNLPVAVSIPGEDTLLRRLDLRGLEVRDALRLVSELCELNVASTPDAGARRVDLLLQNVRALDAIESICKLAQLWYRRDGGTGLVRVMTTQEYRRDQVVRIREVTRTFTLRHPNAVGVAGAIEDLFGERVVLSFGIDEQQLQSMLGGFGGMGAMGGVGGSLAGGGLQPAGGFGAQGGYQGFGGGGFSRSGSQGAGRFARAGGLRSNLQGRDLVGELTADQIARSLPGEGDSLDAERLRSYWDEQPPILVTVQRPHNLIVVRTADPEVLEEIATLIADLDRPMPQVLLEMQVLELQDTEGFRSVFDLGFGSGPDRAGPPDGQPVNPLVPSALLGPQSLGSSLQDALEAGGLVYQFVDERVRARVSLLAQEGDVRILSRPVLLAANDRPARLFVGEERVLITGVQTDTVTPASGATTVSVQPVTEVRDVGTTLLIVPRINADRTVTLQLSQDASSVNVGAAVIPVVGADGTVTSFAIDTVLTATLQGTVVAKDGMTLAVGGLIRSERTSNVQKVPLIGDLPLLGQLFRRQVWQVRESELLLLITPHVLFTPEEAARWGGPADTSDPRSLTPGDPARAPWRDGGAAGSMRGE